MLTKEQEILNGTRNAFNEQKPDLDTSLLYQETTVLLLRGNTHENSKYNKARMIRKAINGNKQTNKQTKINK